MNIAIEEYITKRNVQVQMNTLNEKLSAAVDNVTTRLVQTDYVRNFTWMGIPILQYPSDMMVMQELIWKLRPDYIIETGIAFGGSTLFYATILDALNNGRVIGIDIDPREENMRVLENSFLARRISIFKGSSTEINGNVAFALRGRLREGVVMVVLDSNHTHDHVLKELKLYSPLVSLNSYIVVFDTAIERYGHLDSNRDRPWKPGNNPWTAVQEFMKGNDEFTIDKDIERRALITSAPDGFLQRTKNKKN